MKLLLCIATSMMMCFSTSLNAQNVQKTQTATREYWVETLDKIAFPVMNNLSKGKLKENMPVECIWKRGPKTAHLEAFGRTLCGLGPWLELGPDKTKEGKLRKKYIDMTLKAIDYATNPESPDFMNFTKEQQPLVDAAFLAHGLLRCPTQVWAKLTPEVQQNVINCLISTRVIDCPQNNWLLFRGIIEAFLLENGVEPDMKSLNFAVDKHLQRYKGDGVYGDGDHFHWDYYNSFVIQPMMVDIVRILVKHGYRDEKLYSTVIRRMTRYASILEMMIGTDGTFPPTGRSCTYRMGVFQALSQAALMHILDPKLEPAQVRCAMTATMKRMYEMEGTFEDGWLKIGLAGAQISMAEPYINTGSLYLCTAGFLALGLPPTDPFWAYPDAEWTSLKVWSGKDHKADYYMY